MALVPADPDDKWRVVPSVMLSELREALRAPPQGDAPRADWKEMVRLHVEDWRKAAATRDGIGRECDDSRTSAGQFGYARGLLACADALEHAVLMNAALAASSPRPEAAPACPCGSARCEGTHSIAPGIDSVRHEAFQRGMEWARARPMPLAPPRPEAQDATDARRAALEEGADHLWEHVARHGYADVVQRCCDALRALAAAPAPAASPTPPPGASPTGDARPECGAADHPVFTYPCILPAGHQGPHDNGSGDSWESP